MNWPRFYRIQTTPVVIHYLPDRWWSYVVLPPPKVRAVK